MFPSNMLCPSPLHFPSLQGSSLPGVNTKGLDKVCHVCFPPTCSVRHLYISHLYKGAVFLATILNALTRFAISLSSSMLCPSPLRFRVFAEKQSPEDSPKGHNKVCHVRFPPTCSVRHLYISPTVQRVGQLTTVLKALTKSAVISVSCK